MGFSLHCGVWFGCVKLLPAPLTAPAISRTGEGPAGPESTRATADPNRLHLDRKHTS